MGIKYGKKQKKVKIKDMQGNKDKDRDEPGWLCKCITCGEYGYVTIGDTVPDECADCYSKH